MTEPHCSARPRPLSPRLRRGLIQELDQCEPGHGAGLCGGNSYSGAGS